MPTLTFDSSSIVVAVFGTLLTGLLAVIGFLTRGWWQNLLGIANGNSKQLASILEINQRQSIELAKLGERMSSLDHRVSDVETRQHKLDNRLNSVLLRLGIKTRGDPPDPTEG